MSQQYQSERNKPAPVLLKFESDLTFRKQMTPKQSPKKSLEEQEKEMEDEMENKSIQSS